MPEKLGSAVLELRTDDSKYLAGVRKARGGAAKLGRELKKTGRGAHQFERDLGRAARGADRLSGSLGSVRGVLTGIGVVFGAREIVRGIGAVVSAGADLQAQYLQINQLLRTTGSISGQTAASIERLSREIGFATLASIREVRAAAAQLLTFRAISGDVFERTLRAAQDLASLGFGSLGSSAVQLAKALEDPAQGLTMLRRVGVSFTQTQQDLIRTLHETGRVAEAQRVILANVEAQVGGAGAAAGGGLSGAVDALTEEWNLLTEAWGENIAKGSLLQGVLEGLAGAVSAIRPRNLEEQIELERRRIEWLKQNLLPPPGALALARDRLAALEQEQALLQEQERFAARLRGGGTAAGGLSTDEIERRRAVFDAQAIALDAVRKAEIEHARVLEIVRQAAEAGIGTAQQRARVIERSEARVRAAIMATRAEVEKSLLAAARARPPGALGLPSIARPDLGGRLPTQPFPGAAEEFERRLFAADPVARLNAELTDLQTLQLALGKTTAEMAPLYDDLWSRASTGARDTTDRVGDLSDAFAYVGYVSVDAFARMAEEGGKLIDVLKALAIEISRIGLRTFVTGPLSRGIEAGLGGLFGGDGAREVQGLSWLGRQHGGAVWPGQAFMVGERGPELFVPEQRGAVLAGAGGITINIGPVVSPDADSFNRSLPNLMASAFRAAAREARRRN
jgi:hypothetical protein